MANKYVYNAGAVDSLKVAAKQAELAGGLMTEDQIAGRSKDNAAMLQYWDLTDAIIEGIGALRNAKEKFLPRFIEENNEQYQMRLSLTKFTNVYLDVLETLSSKPFEEEVSLVEDGENVPDFIKELTEDVDGEGNNLTVFANTVFFNGINSAIDWILIDAPDTGEPGARPVTIQEQKIKGIRPYWSHVLARNVLEVRAKTIGGKSVLNYVRLFEPDTISDGGAEPADHVRVFERDELTGRVTWELWRKVEWATEGKDRKYIRVGEGELVGIDVIPMVPFITGRRDGRSFKFLPALQAAADLSLELYLQESGLKYSKTVSAYAMLAGNGVKPDKDNAGNIKPLAIGPMKVLYAPPNAEGSNGSWQFIQPDASVLTFLKDDVKETIQNIRELGKQPLTPQSGNVTVITSAMASGKAKTVVGSWAYALKDALENALVITCKWAKITDYDPEVNVYTEFDDVMDEGKDLDTLNTARTNGDLSQRTYWHELKRRKVLSPEFDPEDEEEKLLDETPGDGADIGENDPAPPGDDPTADPNNPIPGNPPGNPPVNPGPIPPQ